VTKLPHEVLHEASKRVDSAWVQGEFTGVYGGECLIQSVFTAAHLGNANPSSRRGTVPREYREPIDNQLFKTSRYYRHLIRAGYSERAAIIKWNDARWRRKSAVVQVLEAAAEASEFAWLKDERTRLTLTVHNLRNQIARLEARVAQLEEDNSKLRKRLANRSDLKSSQNELLRLSEQLDREWERLTALPDPVK
jgi:hypothetical protein